MNPYFILRMAQHVFASSTLPLNAGLGTPQTWVLKQHTPRPLQYVTLKKKKKTNGKKRDMLHKENEAYF